MTDTNSGVDGEREVFSCCNTWFASLPEGRQAVLREDKWMLAHAAFDAGRASLAPTGFTAEDKWQPIETAPKDGTSVLLMRKHCGSIADGFWRVDPRTGSSAWIWAYVNKTPTHYITLPPPPSGKGV